MSSSTWTRIIQSWLRRLKKKKSLNKKIQLQNTRNLNIKSKSMNEKKNKKIMMTSKMFSIKSLMR